LSSTVRLSRIASALLKMGGFSFCWANSQISSAVLPRKGNVDCAGTGIVVGLSMVEGSMLLMRTPRPEHQFPVQPVGST